MTFDAISLAIMASNSGGLRDIGSTGRELFLYGRQRQRFLCLVVQTRNYRRRRLYRRKHAILERVIGIGKTEFDRGWDVRQCRRALAKADGERA